MIHCEMDNFWLWRVLHFTAGQNIKYKYLSVHTYAQFCMVIVAFPNFFAKNVFVLHYAGVREKPWHNHNSHKIFLLVRCYHLNTTYISFSYAYKSIQICLTLTIHG